MFNWFWKWLGYHVCEEFTQWKTMEAEFERVPSNMTERIMNNYKPIRFIRKWQERSCTICGRIEQRFLKV